MRYLLENRSTVGVGLGWLRAPLVLYDWVDQRRTWDRSVIGPASHVRSVPCHPRFSVLGWFILSNLIHTLQSDYHAQQTLDIRTLSVLDGMLPFGQRPRHRITCLI